MALTKTERRALQRLRAYVNYERARFGAINNDETEHVKTLTRIYRDSWINPIIDALLEDPRSGSASEYLKQITH